MKKEISILLTTAAFVALLCGCISKTNQTPSSWTIDLEGNATTGYSWTASIEDESVLKQTSSEYIDGNSNGSVGAGGIYRFTFEAVSKGTTTVTFTYARSWETVAPLITSSYEVTVDESLTITAEQLTDSENTSITDTNNASHATSDQAGTRSADDELLLQTANAVIAAMKAEDFTSLAGFVHPEKGVTFTPYSTVYPETDRMLTSTELESFLSDSEVHQWGYYDGSGEPIELTNTEYWNSFVWNADYSQADQISLNDIVQVGNSIENLQEAYPSAKFVDYHFDQIEPQYEGMDWCSLKLVFEGYNGALFLVGIIHGQWTI